MESMKCLNVLDNVRENRKPTIETSRMGTDML